ncbi:hypothetical protein [Nocardia harenae]|nr:hypothetical protein [Nocardia harenae]
MPPERHRHAGFDPRPRGAAAPRPGPAERPRLTAEQADGKES